MGTVSKPTIERLSKYYRDLKNLSEAGCVTVSSKIISDMSGVTPAQVRKDLSYFGKFGKRGIGYPVKELLIKIQSLLGLDRAWSMALIGAGNIGAALYNYKEFRELGFNITAVFDKQPEKAKEKLSIDNVYDISEFNKVAKNQAIEIAIIAVPAPNAQKIADIVVNAGVKGILNFAPQKIFVPDNCYLRNANISMELESITFHLAEK